MGSLMSIGALAKRARLPIQTVRFYSDQGLLPPCEVTSAGYRKYSEADYARLEVIRTLRAFDVGLPGIASLLQGECTAQQALRMKKATIDLQQRQLARQSEVLRVALARAGDPLQTLVLLERLSDLDEHEREQLLSSHLRSSMDSVDVDEQWWNALLQGAFEGWPTEFDDDQWSALTALLAIVADETFAQNLAEMARPIWAEDGGFDVQRWQDAQPALVRAVRELQRAGVSATSAEAQKVAGDASRAWARARRTAYRRTCDAQLLEQVARHDPRAAQFWLFVARIRREPPHDASLAYPYLWEALRARVENDSARSG